MRREWAKKKERENGKFFWLHSIARCPFSERNSSSKKHLVGGYTGSSAARKTTTSKRNQTRVERMWRLRGGEENRYRIYFHPHSPFAKLPKKGCSPCMNDTVFVDFNFIPPVLSTTTAFVDARHSLSLLLYILYIKCRKSRSCVTFSRLSTAICHILSRISRWNSSLKCK